MTGPAVDDIPTSDASRLRRFLFTPVDIASLVYFRIAFGAIMLWEVARFFGHGWIERYYIGLQFHFTYFGFEWIRPWPPFGMYAHFICLGALAACIMLGLYYRVATVLFFLGFTYVFLLDEANYLNHFYLVSLISFLLISLPAHRACSMDAGANPQLKTSTVPAWTMWLLRFQIGVAYFFGGIAKINGDWLQCEPMRYWLWVRQDFPWIGRYFAHEWMVHAFAYGGLLFDLLVVPMLLWRKTRWFAVVWLVAFHLLNSRLFGIGIFPWLMLFATPIFLPPHWPRQWLRFVGVKLAPVTNSELDANWSLRQRCLVAALAIFVVLQVTIPLRHVLYPGNVSWTEEGHRFAWHMKLRDKDAEARFTVRDPESNRTWDVDPADYLSERQHRKMTTRPYMILQFSHFLANKWREDGYPGVEVRATAEASLNGRPLQYLVDPTIDLAKQQRTWGHANWIMPLKHPLPW